MDYMLRVIEGIMKLTYIHALNIQCIAEKGKRVAVYESKTIFNCVDLSA